MANEQKNEQNLSKVRDLMSTAKEVNLGEDLKNGVQVDYKTAFGTHIQGTVVFKRPSMKDYMQMGAIKSEQLRQAGVRDMSLVDNTVKFMAHVVATLKVVVVKSPEWLLDVEAVNEPDILYHVYGKYEDWEQSFRQSDTPKAEGDSQPTE